MCQRLKLECQGKKSFREDRVEKQIITLLDTLVCPSPKIIEWVTNELRNQSSDQTETREQTLKGLNTQIDRMDSELYDDKLAGDISRETYEAKHSNFMEQKVELQAKLDKVAKRNTSNLEQCLSPLNLSQKATEIYQTRTIEQKRLILTKLFSSIVFNNGSVSVTYTNFVKVIADKSIKTREFLRRD